MNKRIKLETMHTITGQPWQCQDADAIVERGQEPKRIDSANILHVLKLLVLNIPPALITEHGIIQKITMQDATIAGDFFEQAREAKDGVLTVSDTVYEWLKKVVKDYAPVQFGVNAKRIQDALENLEKSQDKT